MNQSIVVWSVLLLVLFGVAGGYRRFDVLALAGLLSLGALRVVDPAALFDGFGHPALATIVALSVISEAISVSGLLSGLGFAIERRVRTHHSQVLALSLVAASLSAFMSNAGAVAILVPTAIRMARRAGIPAGRYALPIALASIVGGTLTLAGSAPNVIVSGYRLQVTGRPFGMFDYTPHGIAILAAGVLLWLLWGRRLVDGRPSTAASGETMPPFEPLATRSRRMCLGLFAGAIVSVTAGLVTPGIGFGLAAVLMVVTGVIEPAAAYQAIDLRVVMFLGAMLGISGALQKTGAISGLVAVLAPVAARLPGAALIAFVFAVSSTLGNALSNAAAAAVMAPIALTLGGSAGATVSSDGLLMAVAAGSCLAVVLPTHQAVLMARSKAPFTVKRLRHVGLALVLVGGMLAVLVLRVVWM